MADCVPAGGTGLEVHANPQWVSEISEHHESIGAFRPKPLAENDIDPRDLELSESKDIEKRGKVKGCSSILSILT